MSLWVQKPEKTSCKWKKIIFGNPAVFTCESGKYLGDIIDGSVIMRDKIIEVTKTIPTKTVSIKTISTETVSTNFNEKKGNL